MCKSMIRNHKRMNRIRLLLVLLSLSFAGVSAQEPGCPCHRSPERGETSREEGVIVRIYADSVPSGDTIDRVEAHIVGEEIIAVYRNGREVPPHDYDLMVPRLKILLEKEKTLKAEREQLLAKFRDTEQLRDSLENAPLQVDGITMMPDEIRKGNFITQLTPSGEQKEYSDTSSGPRESLSVEKIAEIRGKAEALLAERYDEIESLSMEMEMLKEQVVEIESRLNEIEENFTYEIYPAEEQEEIQKEKKEKGGFRKRFRKKKKKKH